MNLNHHGLGRDEVSDRKMVIFPEPRGGLCGLGGWFFWSQSYVLVPVLVFVTTIPYDFRISSFASTSGRTSKRSSETHL
jgi:hypothetical protein